MRKFLIILTFIAVLVTVGVFIAQLVARSDRILVEVVSFPDNPSLTVNGRSIGETKSFYISPGANVVTASKEGFSDYRTYLDIDENPDDNRLVIELAAQSDEAKQWAEDNYDIYARINRVASEQSAKSQQRLLEAQPIVEHLPFRNRLFSIGYVRPQPDTFEVTIRASNVYVPYALNQIRQWGYDPEQLNIQFINQGNPFDEI